MEQTSEDSQINKKPRLATANDMAQQQVSDDRGDDHSSNIGNDDTAVIDLASELDLVHVIDEKFDTVGGEIEALQRGVTALAEQIDAGIFTTTCYRNP